MSHGNIKTLQCTAGIGNHHTYRQASLNKSPTVNKNQARPPGRTGLPCPLVPQGDPGRCGRFIVSDLIPTSALSGFSSLSCAVSAASSLGPPVSDFVCSDILYRVITFSFVPEDLLAGTVAPVDCAGSDIASCVPL